MTLDHQERQGRAKSRTASGSPGSNIWVPCAWFCDILSAKNFDLGFGILRLKISGDLHGVTNKENDELKKNFLLQSDKISPPCYSHQEGAGEISCRKIAITISKKCTEWSKKNFKILEI